MRQVMWDPPKHFVCMNPPDAKRFEFLAFSNNLDVAHMRPHGAWKMWNVKLMKFPWQFHKKGRKGHGDHSQPRIYAGDVGTKKTIVFYRFKAATNLCRDQTNLNIWPIWTNLLGRVTGISNKTKKTAWNNCQVIGVGLMTLCQIRLWSKISWIFITYSNRSIQHKPITINELILIKIQITQHNRTLKFVTGATQLRRGFKLFTKWIVPQCVYGSAESESTIFYLFHPHSLLAWMNKREWMTLHKKLEK